MAELVTSESRRYLHGIQNTIISDDATGVALNEVPVGNQLTLVDQMEVDGELTVYGDAYVTSSKNADSLSGVNHNEISGRDVYAAHPASSVALVPVGSVVATDMQSAVAELDAGKVTANPPLSPSTKTKITYDSKGLVTSGSNATASDIANVPYGGVVAVNVQDAINAVESHASSAQAAANTAQTTANNAATAAAAAQTAANNAATAAAYADRLARSSNNLIKNGNSEDPNPSGWEAAWISDSGAYTGTRCRALTVETAGGYPQATVGEAPCDPGDQFVFRAWGKQAVASIHQYIFIEFLDAAGARVGYKIKAFPASTSYTQTEASLAAPAGAARVRFLIYVDKADVTTYYWDCLYACRKVSAGMLEDDAVRSTTHAFAVSDTTASTSTTTGAIVAAGGIATGDYFTGRYRSQDGSSGITGTKTFYAASSSGGSATVLNTVVVKNGIITSWTQA